MKIGFGASASCLLGMLRPSLAQEEGRRLVSSVPLYPAPSSVRSPPPPACPHLGERDDRSRSPPPPMAARRGPHVIHLHDSGPPLLGRAPKQLQAQQPAADHDEPPPPSALLLNPARGALAPHPAVAALEDRLASRDRDMQELLVDNQRFAATHVALQQQLIALQHELRAVSIAAHKARAEREAEVHTVAEQATRIEVEARTVVGARGEIEQVHADVRVLAAARTELVDRLQVLREQLVRAQAESSQADGFRAQIETMRREIQKGRAAVDFEKKAHADNLEQSKSMEQNMISVASEIEKLRGDLVNAEKRATAVTTAASVANPGYAATYGNPEATYTATYGNPEATYAAAYGNSESTYPAVSYSDAYSTSQAHARPDGNPQPHYIMAPPVHYAQHEGQHTNVQR